MAERGGETTEPGPGSGESADDDGRTAVALRDDVHERIRARVERTDFESPAAYVEFAMEEVLARVEEVEAETEGGDDDLAEVERRLESLGYR